MYSFIFFFFVFSVFALHIACTSGGMDRRMITLLEEAKVLELLSSRVDDSFVIRNACVVSILSFIVLFIRCPAVTFLVWNNGMSRPSLNRSSEPVSQF